MKNKSVSLTAPQRDALEELINIGFGRAAKALSVMVGQRVSLQTPSVEVYPLAELEKAFQFLVQREMTTIHQVFSGKLCGDIMLLMDVSSASILVDLLNDGIGEEKIITPADQETLTEIGNILLNAFIGSFGNLLNVHISFAVPNLRLESISQMMLSLTVDEMEIEFALVVKVMFKLTQGEVSGYVIIIMGIQSLEALFDAMRDQGYIE
jgi:chemotaxis protein CheC